MIKGLAAWRVSHILVDEDGPYEIFKNFRAFTGIQYDSSGNVTSYPPGSPLMCIYCTSVWVAAALFFLPTWVSKLFAISGIAIAVHETRKAWLERQ
jgi:hypothetical protein